MRFRMEHPAARAAKFRQAAFVYLHVAVLYETAVFAMWRAGLVSDRFGPPWVWLFLIVPPVVGLVFWGLYHWQHPWFARGVWVIHGMRLPALIQSAFFPEEAVRLPSGFYLTAIVVVVLNLWMLARAGWDL
ncbi:MAG: hypothetical protein HY560_13695 [Gemmatimonadetes bacterium]|nr:hypothetical protein [Gemmatimonadota bacterium]